MAGANFDRKVSNAFTKVGNKLGYTTLVYRPDDLTNPVQDKNILFKTMMSWSEDESYTKNPEDVLTYFTLYMNYSKLKLGDMLVIPELSRTFIVSEIVPIRGAVGVQCSDSVNILRPVYDMTADKKTSFNAVITKLPVALELKSGGSRANGLAQVNSNVASGSSSLEAWTWVPAGAVQINDVVEYNGNRYLVSFVSSTNKGTFITAQSMKVGK